MLDRPKSTTHPPDPLDESPSDRIPHRLDADQSPRTPEPSSPAQEIRELPRWMAVDRETDRFLILLHSKLRERGYTQLEVQATLGWGRSYISQLLTKAKTLRLDQVYSILEVIGVEPGEFFGELYGSSPAYRRGPAEKAPAETAGLDAALEEVRQLEVIQRSLLGLLIEKGLVNARELAAAVKVGGRRISCASS